MASEAAEDRGLLESQKSASDFYKRMKEGQTRGLGIVVKGVYRAALRRCASRSKLSTDEVKVSIVHSGVST